MTGPQSENALQPLETVERQGHLRPDACRTGRSGRRHRYSDDRSDASEDTPHGLQPDAEKRGRGRLNGRTKGGMNSKLHTVTDALGRPLRMFMTAGQCSDFVGARALLDGLPSAKHILADRGHDADWYREALETKGITPCRPARKGRKVPIPHDEARYRKRHTNENSVARLKNWRRVATCYDRCPKVFLSACALAGVVKFWLRILTLADAPDGLVSGGCRRLTADPWVAPVLGAEWRLGVYGGKGGGQLRIGQPYRGKPGRVAEIATQGRPQHPAEGAGGNPRIARPWRVLIDGTSIVGIGDPWRIRGPVLLAAVLFGVYNKEKGLRS
ncbi:MAG: IS5 family transposase [Rhodobacteraceae bacterium]|nr:MAG: IS5 family transposase [Paracoccaceae bacterium]